MLDWYYKETYDLWQFYFYKVIYNLKQIQL